MKGYFDLWNEKNSAVNWCRNVSDEIECIIDDFVRKVVINFELPHNESTLTFASKTVTYFPNDVTSVFIPKTVFTTVLKYI